MTSVGAMPFVSWLSVRTPVPDWKYKLIRRHYSRGERLSHGVDENRNIPKGSMTLS